MTKIEIAGLIAVTFIALMSLATVSLALASVSPFLGCFVGFVGFVVIQVAVAGIVECTEDARRRERN